MIKSWQQLSEYQPEEAISAETRRCQEKWLLDCIGGNKETRYGKTHKFEKIKTVSDYQKQLPIVSYQDISGYIDKTEKGELDCLFAGAAIAFERTSGSTSSQKLIPYSPASIHDFRRAVLPWLSGLVKEYGITSGYAYWAISPATRQAEYTSSGIPIGLPDVAYLGEDLIPFFLESSVMPPWVAELSDIKAWQLASLYYLVICRELSLISVWSPTFLLTLITALGERREELEGALWEGLDMQGNRLAKNRRAYADLQNYYQNKEWTALWPDLKLISCWADASSRPYFEILRSHFQGVPIQPKGLLLTEGVVTVPGQQNQTLLSANSGFYEFINDEGFIRLAHELSAGERYEVVITTAGGLYRYRTYDRVVCDGYASNLPVLRFVGRALASDMVGEKLSEEFANSCLEDITGFRMLLPIEAETPRYALIVEDRPDIESIIIHVERRLYENPHYAYACKLGQLAPLSALVLNDPLGIYLNSAVHRGIRLGDTKIPSLCLKTAIFKDYMGTIA